MDDLTRERFGAIPYRERYAKPNPLPARANEIKQRRAILCGSPGPETDPKVSLPRGELEP